MKSTWKKYLLYAAYILLASGLLYGLLQLILSGYTVTWTGFQTKTLWDWMELLVIPIVLALGAFFLNRSERAVERQIAEDRRKEDRKLADDRAELEREIAKDRQQEEALQTYLDRMSELLLEKRLETKKAGIEGRNVAKIRTVSILRVLNQERKKLVIKFLRDAKLITDTASILNEIDMYGIDVIDLDFNKVFLQRVHFFKADFGVWANLREANLEGAQLIGAKLPGAFLNNADLQSAIMFRANLERADLEGANLANADLNEANLKGAKVTPEQLSRAKYLIGTIMPDGTVHE